MAGKNGAAEEELEPQTFEAEDEVDTPKPVAIDLSDDGAAPATVEGEEAPAAEEVKTEPEERPALKPGQMYDRDGKVVYKSSAKAKINELYYKEKQARQENEQLRQQLDAERAEKIALAKISQQRDVAAMATHKEHWQAESRLAKQELSAAHAAQDYDKVAEATGKVSAAESELQAIRAYEANIPAAPVERREQPAPRGGNGQEQQPQTQEVTPQMQAWAEENPYVLGGTPDFDQEMAGFAVTAAATLDGRYRRAGRSAEIGSEAYLGQLTDLIREEFPEYWDEQPAPEPQRKQRRAIPMTRPNGAQVAPVSRQTIAQPGAPGSNMVTLSPKEQNMALKMNANGAYPKYPAGHAKAGKIMDNADALRYHAKYVKDDRKEQAAKKESM